MSDPSAVVSDNVGTCDEGSIVAHGYRRVDRGQGFLLPPDVREWLPEDHLAWAVIDAVEQFDLSAFAGKKRADGKGRAAYAPTVMVALLLYAYAVGERSSRRIERRCHEDVALRVITANEQPDHATIARFRARHEVALAELFTQVLALCAAAGLGRVGLVSLDSTKIKADASDKANKPYRAIREQVDAMLADAAAADADDDRDAVADGGSGLPEALADHGERLRRLAAAKARVDAEHEADHAAWRERMARREELATQGKKPPGRPLKQGAVEPTIDGRRANTTDPDSSTLRRPGGFVQGYSAHAMTTDDGVILATHVTNEQSDAHWLHPLLTLARHNLAVAGVVIMMRVLLADRGYYSDDNVTAATPEDPELLIATMSGRRQQAGAAPAKPHRSKTMQAMADKLATDRGRLLYRRRQHTIEPIFGDLKHNNGFTRFARRGLAACDAEWALACTAHNLKKWAAARRPVSETRNDTHAGLHAGPHRRRRATGARVNIGHRLRRHARQGSGHGQRDTGRPLGH